MQMLREDAHAIADLLEQVRLYDGPDTPGTPPIDEPDWGEVEAWTDRLRKDAGPKEPTSLAARFVGWTNESNKYEWARALDGLWYVLDGSRSDGLPWGQLVHSYTPYFAITTEG